MVTILRYVLHPKKAAACKAEDGKGARQLSARNKELVGGRVSLYARLRAKT